MQSYLAANVFDAKGLWAVPGFGESHKHIQSTLLSPEWEAPQGLGQHFVGDR